jgi:beta-glucosidase
VLFGDVSPSGRLTVSMPKRTGQEPLYYSILPTGRPMEDNEPDYHVFSTNYVDVTNGALYPFGYGLTYSTFEYGRPQLEGNTLSVRLSNTGQREATEVVQLYIHDREASVSRPKKELKGFRRITLRAGESQVVTFEITPDLLGYYDGALRWVVEKGDFDIMVGPDSHRLQSLVYQF